jgi:hypothetical protein
LEAELERLKAFLGLGNNLGQVYEEKP